MTELKTLKDLIEEKSYAYSQKVFASEIKAEAVKWVKELKSIGKDREWSYSFFMDFFNLTEELKNGK